MIAQLKDVPHLQVVKREINNKNKINRKLLGPMMESSICLLRHKEIKDFNRFNDLFLLLLIIKEYNPYRLANQLKVT